MIKTDRFFRLSYRRKPLFCLTLIFKWYLLVFLLFFNHEQIDCICNGQGSHGHGEVSEFSGQWIWFWSVNSSKLPPKEQGILCQPSKNGFKFGIRSWASCARTIIFRKISEKCFFRHGNVREFHFSGWVGTWLENHYIRMALVTEI